MNNWTLQAQTSPAERHDQYNILFLPETERSRSCYVYAGIKAVVKTW